ncbi:acetolactate synthase, large subunit, biosynthetic type [Bacillus cytotoxicus NVH 391-98]|uniref:Acetolactate synthase, large subunit, biosynthetic type n=2 Tax=Bacillus cytotoxicus TaxID=580165 RepID=A0AAX2CFE6_9BACI|nr:acetolactate synthase, large subunit, biosynthetic type [Bacillus cytotoxicus NVH 391-98]SCL89814.1 Acetolactate synthase, large subunit, biosynthetic type [Bacillus cytotoxicus]SCN34697.1 Acetolactate synthase, large subunit, biosynthetic type [Bacillus cytotoxicus]
MEDRHTVCKKKELEEGKESGASHVIQCLKKLGETTVFGYLGGAI